jgi:hypothetical protein
MAPIYSSSVISISKITLRTLKQASSTDTVLSLMSAPVKSLHCGKAVAKSSDASAQGYPM